MTQWNQKMDTEKGPSLSEKLEIANKEIMNRDMELRIERLEAQHRNDQINQLKEENLSTKDELKNQTDTFKTKEDSLTNTIIKLKKRKPKIKVIFKEPAHREPNNIQQSIIFKNKKTTHPSQSQVEK